MINFEEELKKFHPSLEVEDAEEAIYNQDLTDMADILVKMISDVSREAYNRQMAEREAYDRQQMAEREAYDRQKMAEREAYDRQQMAQKESHNSQRAVNRETPADSEEDSYEE